MSCATVNLSHNIQIILGSKKMKQIFVFTTPFFIVFHATAMEQTKKEIELFPTPRMQAHRICEQDLGNLYSLLSNPEVGKTIMGGEHTLEQTKEALARLLNRWKEHGYGSWMFHDKNNNAFIGRAGLHPASVDGNDEIVVSCAILPEYWNKGYATEMGQELKRIAFEKLAFKSIALFTQRTNYASRKAIEKTGATYEKTILDKTGPYKDLELRFYRLTKE